MENLYQEFLDDLKKNEPKYFTGDTPLKNLIIEDSLKLEPNIIKFIISNLKLKEQFITEIENTLIFDKVKFQEFINSTEFLPDSYTKFKQDIGLSVDGKMLKKNQDVVLVWPYKDCILEGGQTKEDTKRSEIFYNEILAPDQINRLKEPKAFTNLKYFARLFKSSTKLANNI